MRKEINVLWLDDNNGEDLDIIKDVFASVFEENGYKTIYLKCENYEQAETKLNDNSVRIDFFVSDFNLDEKRDGLNFLLDIRKKDKIKQFFVLYSNSTKDRMRKRVKELINQDLENVDLFNNYYFFSTAPDFNEQSLRREFEKIAFLSLIRWNELNALRGEYASINTLLEWTIRNIFQITDGTTYEGRGGKDYSGCIELLNSRIRSNCLICSISASNVSNIFAEWAKERKARNTLEHNVEKWDSSLSDFLIENPDHSIQFFEKNIIDYRKSLINFVALIKNLFDDLFSNNSSIQNVKFSQEYVDLIKGL